MCKTLPVLRTSYSVLVLAFLLTSDAARAADWPAHRHDLRRSGVTAEDLDAAKLGLDWEWRSPSPPQPAWAGPAKWDAYRNMRGLPSMRSYDAAMHVAVVGDSLLFGSSSDDGLHCLDTATGKQTWTFRGCDGPIRSAPTVSGGKVYFGSDDGSAYCVDLRTGSQVWEFCPSDNDRLVLHNGRPISFWPCRTGVVVHQGTAYFAGSMLPWKKSYLCAVDANTGNPEGEGRYVHEVSGMTFEGPPAVGENMLVFPQGRVAPLVFDRLPGKGTGRLPGGGGSFVLMTEDAKVMHGPGVDSRRGAIGGIDAKTRAKIAAFPQGTALVVAGDTAYTLTATSLTASDWAKRQQRWTVATAHPYSLIMAGGTLYAGGQDEVAAFSAKDGERLWARPIVGKAHGLAVAGGRLFVSTDSGRIYAFRPGASGIGFPPVKPETPEPKPEPSAVPLKPIEPVKDDALIGRWVFQQPHTKGNTVKDLAGKLDATISGPVRLSAVGKRQAIALDGRSNNILIRANHNDANLPAEGITAGAWVRVDQPLTWGGIVGALQDNGSYERGWILGYTGSKFSFAVAAKGGPGALTYMAAETDFAVKRWHHVVGTYDGTTMKLYVNGKLAASSTAQKGEINYPPRTFFEIGAYHDDNEYYRVTGMLREVRVYRRALTAEEARKHYQTMEGDFPDAPKQSGTGRLAAGPWVTFQTPDVAVVRWHTFRPSPTVLDCSLDGKTKRVEDTAAKTEHEARLTGLRHNRVYTYTIGSVVDGAALTTAPYELDTFFNFAATQPAVAKPESDAGERADNPTAKAARHILAQTKIDRGLCVVLGSKKGDLAYELARHSRLRIIGFDTDEKNIAAARSAELAEGPYGNRVTFLHAASLADLPLSGCANLIVSDAAANDGKSIEESKRLLRPSDGILSGRSEGVDWTAITNGPLPGAGDWTHQYGRADNSAFGGETLGGASKADDFEVQWIGRPGPRFQPDRNGRKPSPLSTRGRLFVQGLHRIAALDAFNGVPLWSLEIPDLQRFNLPRDCSNWCADDASLYVAIRNKCWRIDAADGGVARFYNVVAGPKADWQYDWGYVVSDGERLVGSAVKEGTSWTNFWGGGGAGWYDAAGGAVTAKVCSENLFALNKDSGKTVWTYTGGVLVNSTITIGGGRVYFVECRNAKVKADESRRVGLPELWQDQFLVALDAATGRKLYERPIDTADGIVVFYLAFGEGKLALVASGGNQYHVHTFDAAGGKDVWNKAVKWQSSHHGGHMSRPAIVGGSLYVRPHAMDLDTGEPLKSGVPGGGCGTYACTTGALFFRSGTVTVWDRATGGRSTWARLRPDCWLSTIPASGMLLSPEGGGGCSCGNWMETSVGFAPRPKR